MRAGRVRTTALRRIEKRARPLSPAQHHQAPPRRELDEGAGLPRHVDGIGREPIDELGGTRETVGRWSAKPVELQAPQVVVCDRDPQTPAAGAAAITAKIQVA